MNENFDMPEISQPVAPVASEQKPPKSNPNLILTGAILVFVLTVILALNILIPKIPTENEITSVNYGNYIVVSSSVESTETSAVFLISNRSDFNLSKLEVSFEAYYNGKLVGSYLYKGDIRRRGSDSMIISFDTLKPDLPYVRYSLRISVTGAKGRISFGI